MAPPASSPNTQFSTTTPPLPPRRHLVPLPLASLRTTAGSSFSASRRRSHLSSATQTSKVVNRPRGDRGRFISPCTEENRSCRECGAVETSQWRTASDGSSLCNACGIRSTRKANGTASSRRSGRRGRRSHSTLHISPLHPPTNRPPGYGQQNILPSYEQLASSVRSHAYPKPNSSLAKILN